MLAFSYMSMFSLLGYLEDGRVEQWILGKLVLIANIGDAKDVLARSTTNNDQKSSENSNCTWKAIFVTIECNT